MCSDEFFLKHALHSMLCFYHSLLKISLCQEFCPLGECLFSCRYPSFNFSVKFDISSIIPYRQQNLFILIYYFFSSSVILTVVSFPLLIFNTFLFLTNIFISACSFIDVVQCIRYCLQYRPLPSCNRRLVIYS